MVYEVRNIDKSYQNNQVLKKVSFHIPSNKITVILGKNGAGKTTLIKLMLGMITVDKGEILFKGNPISKLSHTYYKQVSAVLESVDNVYPFLTGKQNIEYFLGLSNLSISYVSDSIQHLINEFDLKDAINQPVGGYSRGMLPQCKISCVTSKQP